MIGAVDAWAQSDELARIVESTGGAASALLGAARLDELAAFSVAWDARGGLERDQARVRQPDPREDRLVLEGAAALGQSGRSDPKLSHYDAILMTGGMVRAEIVKPRFVRELLNAGITTDRVDFLGGYRPFSAEEQELARRLGMTSADEFDAMAEGMDLALGPLGPPARAGDGDAGRRGWRECAWRSGARSLSVLAAPSSDPVARRAHTADTFRFWAERRDALSRVLVVTTPVYVPYQAAVAVDVLGLEFGIAVETVGVTASASDLGTLTQPFLAQHHLQELRSAVLAMRGLRAALSLRRA